MQRVLLADDSVAARKSIQQVLEMAGIEVVSVGNGDLALARIDVVRPEMVLVDVVMPGRSGYEVCEMIKSRPEYANVPVVLVTSDFEPYDPDEAARVGADGHIVKPFDSEALVRMRDVWSRYAPREVELAPEPRALVPPPEFTHRAVTSEADGSSTHGIDAYTTVAIPIAQIMAASQPPAEQRSGTMVVGPDALALPQDPPPEPEAPAELPEVPRRRTAPLPDIAIDSLDEEVDLPPAAEPLARVVSAPTTENLDTGLADDAAEIVRTATEVGIRRAESGELHVASGRCPSCGAALSPGDIFCLACGAAVLEGGAEAAHDDVCTGCGLSVAPGDIFCVGCGAAL